MENPNSSEILEFIEKNNSREKEGINTLPLSDDIGIRQTNFSTSSSRHALLPQNSGGLLSSMLSGPTFLQHPVSQEQMRSVVPAPSLQQSQDHNQIPPVQDPLSIQHASDPFSSQDKVSQHTVDTWPMQHSVDLMPTQHEVGVSRLPTYEESTEQSRYVEEASLQSKQGLFPTEPKDEANPTSAPAIESASTHFAISQVSTNQLPFAAPTGHSDFELVKTGKSPPIAMFNSSKLSTPTFSVQPSASFNPLVSVTTTTETSIGSQTTSTIFGGIQTNTSRVLSKTLFSNVPHSSNNPTYSSPSSTIASDDGQTNLTNASLFSSTSSSGSTPRIFGGSVTAARPKPNVFGRFILNPVTRASYMKPTTLTTSTTQASVGSISSIQKDNLTKVTALPPANSVSTLGMPAPVFSHKLRNNSKEPSANIFGGIATNIVPSDTIKNRHPYAGPISYHSTSNSSPQGSEKENNPNPLVKAGCTPLEMPTDKIGASSERGTEPIEPDADNSKKQTDLKNKNSANKAASPVVPRNGSEPLDLSERTTDISPNVSNENASTLRANEITDKGKKGSTVVIAVEIPHNYLNKSVLINHFSKFGKVNKILINQKSSQASIYFNDHNAASAAKLKGKKLHPLIPEMKLFFGASLQSKEPIPSKKPTLSRPASSSNPFSISHKPSIKKPPVSESKQEKKSMPIAPSKKIEVRNKAPSGNISSIKDLSVLMNAQSHNSYDKYLILDARDKHMRMKQKKEHDVNKAVYLSATCPDMCPEKERYSRDIQYDVSTYEMTDAEIDHRLSVKKFSRSSADKDEPLPHELRPGSVLKMTMDFLVCNIIEKGDKENVQLDVWYNYLCNRTRALRNDIMQQHLVDHHAVYVLEKCTRFHIHCSHHLCEEPPDLFDSKMNTEHLTKSLQSLKELYHDLGEKGVYYESEAEFRAYEIILNVNDGNIIFKYLKFRDPIRESREVQFAVKVLYSIHTNNYIKFFKLLKKATYLQACLMHRYFTSIRLKTLNIIVKAYSVPNKVQFLPMEEMMKKLGLSSEKNFKKYIKHFGLNVNENNKIAINRNKFLTKPENLPALNRSLEITQKKGRISIGMLVQGGPLPTNPLLFYKPHNSFNEKGFLNKAAFDASDQQCMETNDVDEITISPNETLTTDDFAKELSLKLNKMVEMKLFHKYFGFWLKFVAMQREKKAELAEKSKILLAKRILRKWRIKASESVKSKQKADRYILSKYFAKWRNHTFRLKQLDDLRRKIKELENKVILRKAFNSWRSMASKKSAARKLNFLRSRIVSRKFFIKWRLIASASVSVAKEISDLHYSTTLYKTYFQHWRKWILAKRAREELNLTDFPAIGSMLPIEKQNKLWDWGYSRKRSLNVSASQISEIDNDIHVKFRKHNSLQKLSEIISWAPLPLLQRFQSDINASPPDFSGNIFSYYFKFSIFIDPSTDPYFVEWVRTKFNILEMDDLTVPLESKSRITSHKNGVAYTIIVSEKELLFQKGCNFDSGSLVVLVSNENKLEKVKCIASKVRNVPCLILCRSWSTVLYQSNTVLLTKEAIENPYASEKLFDCIFQFWKNRSSIGCLQASKLHSLVSSFISKTVLGPLYNVVSLRLFYKQPYVSPTVFVCFYNAAISHIIDCLNMARAQFGDGPPSEAYPEVPLSQWKTKKGANVISKIENAVLPDITIESRLTYRELDEILATYINSIASVDEWGGQLFSEINKIFKNTEMQEMISDGNYPMSDVNMSKVPWIDIITCCIFYKLSYLPDDVFYNLDQLESFDSNYWISQIRISKLDANETDIVKPIEKLQKAKRKGSSPLHETEPATKQKCVRSSLLQDLEDEKCKASEFENKLKALIADEEELQMLTKSYRIKEL